MAFRHTALAAAFLFAAAGIASAQEPAPKDTKEKSTQKSAPKEPTLKVGDKAPELHIAKWVKGDPVTGFEKGKTYVVEFWATWCGPCIASMPHLTSLQKEYRDRVTIIGVTSEDPNNSLEQVQDMVKEKGADGMGYTVAFDEDRKTNDAYMKAAAQRGIPCSFVIDGAGKIAYIGHPMWLDIPLEQITKGTWDPAKGMDALKVTQDKFGKVYQLKDSDPEAALKAIAEIEQASPAAAAMLGNIKYEILLKTDEKKAKLEGRQLMMNAYNRKDAQALNGLAWSIVDPAETHEKQDLDLAFEAAKKAVELTKEKDGAILDTLARVYFIKGDTAKAIELQKKAIANTSGPMKEELEKSLAEYEAKK